MKLQAYRDGQVHIFKDNIFVCSFTITQLTPNKIDKHLKLLRLRRRNKCQDREWGIEADIRFNTKK